MTDWLIFRGTGQPHDEISRLPPPPSWRVFAGGPPITPAGDPLVNWKPSDIEHARWYQASPDVIQLVNAAIYLRRPLLVTGKPGVGKSTLSLAISYELGLGPVLRWPITSRSTLQEGLYKYDAISRLHDVNLNSDAAKADIGRYITLGPLGTALLPFSKPRVLLIDEIDKSDIDLPNDLLTVFEEGEYEIPELVRAARDQPEVHPSTADGAIHGPILKGQVRCRAFPVVVLTSNREREFPPAFLRRCVSLEITPPSPERLARIVEARLGPDMSATAAALIDRFLDHQKHGDVATDQLLNAIYLTFHAASRDDRARSELADLLLRHLQPTSI
jgi:MoxR-like ATPase